MSDLKFDTERFTNYAIVAVKNDKLNSVVAPDLKSEFVLISNDGIKSLILDLTDVAFADSSGLSAILAANRLCGNAGGHLALVGINDYVKKLIQISKLDSILNIMESMEDAKTFLMLKDGSGEEE